MLKIIIRFDGSHFSNGAFEFVRKQNESKPLLLVGVFLPGLLLADYTSFYIPATIEIPPPMLIVNEDEIESQKNMAHFKELCVKNNIEHRVHGCSDEFILPQLQRESRFADLIVLGDQLFYNYSQSDKEIGSFLKILLHSTECPVLLVPENYEFPQQVILAYDGTPSSVYAIKQFAYIFPDLCKNSTLLVYANKEEKNELPELSYVEELAARHFSDLTLFTLNAEPKYFETWLNGIKAPIVVMGAYDRSAFSQLFRKSFAEEVIEDYKAPVFIAHR